MREITSDRSRSRDPPRETTLVVPIAQPQVELTVPNYLLPIMATADIGHISLDQSRTRSTGDLTPPRAPEASSPSIRDLFESFHQAQGREDQLKAIQQLTAELMGEPPLSGSPTRQETPDRDISSSTGAVSGRISSPHPPTDTAAAASRESESPQEGSKGVTPEPPSTERGRQPSMKDRVKSAFYWPSLRSITGSSRRPKSPPLPPRPKPEPAPKRANSMPRISDSAFAESPCF